MGGKGGEGGEGDGGEGTPLHKRKNLNIFNPHDMPEQCYLMSRTLKKVAVPSNSYHRLAFILLLAWMETAGIMSARQFSFSPILHL